MPVRTSAWPIEALPFEEILTPVVESFLGAEERGAFDFSRRSAIQQLYDRVDALGALPRGELLDSLDPRSTRRVRLLGDLQFWLQGTSQLTGDDIGKPLGEELFRYRHAEQQFTKAG